MVTLKRSGGIVVMGAAAAVVIVVSAGPAFAAAKWTVTPGGPMTASGTMTLTDSRSGASLSCASSNAAG